MFDLHCHLLHGVDDGPDTLEESLALCSTAVQEGTTHAIVTPHIHPGRWENTRDSIERACKQLQGELDQRGIPLCLGYAAEVRLTDRIPDQVAREEIPFYGEVDGFKLMLLEFPHGQVIPGGDKLAAWLIERGIRPLIAHPERNRQVMRDVSLLRPYLDLGCWLQVTAGSLMGQFGERSEHVARHLLEQNEVKVMASDGHNRRARPPVLGAAFKSVSNEFGEERAQRLFMEEPARIAADQFA